MNWYRFVHALVRRFLPPGWSIVPAQLRPCTSVCTLPCRTSRVPAEGMMHIEAHSPWKAKQRWHRSFCEDHLWWGRNQNAWKSAYMVNLWKRRREEKKEKKKEKGGVIKIGEAFTWSSRDMSMLRADVPYGLSGWLTAHPTLTFPYTYVG